jgi:hypothetical protein
VYNTEWGRFILRNGLMAFAVMQGWGTNPADYATGKPGKALLDAIGPAVSPTTAPSPAALAAIDVLLGFDKPTTAIPKRAVFNSALDAGDYRVVILDTRTHRAVNDLSVETPNLVDNLDEQLPERPATATQSVLVVVSAVPVFGPVMTEVVGQPLAGRIRDMQNLHRVGEIPGFAPGDAADPARNAGCGERATRGSEKYDREGWSANDAAFEALVARLASWRTVVLLSGDVHFAYTMSLDYFKKGTSAPARIVQCVSSPAKNVFKEVVDQVLRQVRNLQRAEELPIERIAWTTITAADLVPAGARLSITRRGALRRRPALLPTRRWPPGAKIPAAKPPDWSWRISPVTDNATKRADLPSGLQLPPFPANIDTLSSPQRLTQIAAVHQQRLTANVPPLRRVIFRANFGTIGFRGSGDAVEVVHTLYSPVSAAPFPPSDADPLTATGAIPDPAMAFGPHTVHAVTLKPAATVTPPTLQST